MELLSGNLHVVEIGKNRKNRRYVASELNLYSKLEFKKKTIMF